MHVAISIIPSLRRRSSRSPVALSASAPAAPGPIRLRVRRLLGLALALAVVGGGSSAATASASWHSVGCTAAEGSLASYVCLRISGPHGNNWFRVTRNQQYTSICRYKARVRVSQPTLGTLNYYSPYNAGCSWNTAWMDIYPRRGFQFKSKACGHWYEQGRWIAGTPCNIIY